MVARRSNNRVRKQVERRSRSWWWLALPLLGVAAYAAFDATLGLVTPADPDRALPVPAASTVDAPAPAPIMPASEAPLAAADSSSGVPVATDALPTPTAAEPQAAAASAAVKPKAKPKVAAPKENLTERDRRALDRVIERAGEQGDAR